MVAQAPINVQNPSPNFGNETPTSAESEIGSSIAQLVTRGSRSIGGSQGVSGVEQPTTGHLDHRPPELIGRRIYGVPSPEEGRAGQTSRDAAPGWQRIPSKDQWSASDVGHRRFVFQSVRLGLLLHGDRDERLLPVHPGLEAATGHDI